MEDLLEPSPGNQFAALWTVACNYSTVALVLINAWNTFNALCYLLWVPPCKWELSAVLLGAGDWNLRAELRQCRKQRAQVSSAIAAILCSICSRSASAALPASNFTYAVFYLFKSFPERGVELADTNRCICCLLYKERTCLCMLLPAACEWRNSDTATNYGPQFIHLPVCSSVPEVTLHIFHSL